MLSAVKVGGGRNRKKNTTQTIGAMKQEAGLMKNNFFRNWTLLQGPQGNFNPRGAAHVLIIGQKLIFSNMDILCIILFQILSRLRYC